MNLHPFRLFFFAFEFLFPKNEKPTGFGIHLLQNPGLKNQVQAKFHEKDKNRFCV